MKCHIDILNEHINWCEIKHRKFEFEEKIIIIILISFHWKLIRAYLIYIYCMNMRIENVWNNNNNDNSNIRYNNIRLVELNLVENSWILYRNVYVPVCLMLIIRVMLVSLSLALSLLSNTIPTQRIRMNGDCGIDDEHWPVSFTKFQFVRRCMRRWMVQPQSDAEQSLYFSHNEIIFQAAIRSWAEK